MSPRADIGDPATLQSALDRLAGEGVVVLPTDTLYGLHARLSSASATARIRRIKGGGSARRFVVLAAGVDMALEYVASFGCASTDEMRRRWPAPLTVVVPPGPRCPSWAGDTIAVRVPDLAWLRELIAALGEPLVSTSVNRAGESPRNDPDEIARSFEVDLVVAGEEDTAGGASTIVDLCGEKARVLRAGGYDWAAATGDSNPSK